jgi:hypothetical protein
MTVTTDILRSWRHPRVVLREKLAAGVREDRALAMLMGACGLIFVAEWPAASREAHLLAQAAAAAGTPAGEVPDVQALLGGRLMALIFIAPLLFYGLAALSRGVARLAGGRGTGYGARLALFWALLCTTPAILFHGLLRGFLGAQLSVTLVGVGVLALFLYLWISMLIEAET